MRGHHAEIRALGAELTLIGSGSPAHAQAFREAEGVEALLLCDTRLEAFAAAGLKRSISSTFSLGTLKHGLRAFKQGHRQSAVQGDPWQQGGLFVCAPGDEVLFAHVSQAAGDHPEPAAFLDSLRGRNAT